MSKEKIVYYKCPFCGEGEILSYRKWNKTTGGACSKYEYLGACCSYYPHTNKKVDEALKRLTPEKQDLPTRCTSFAQDKSRIKKMEMAEC